MLNLSITVTQIFFKKGKNEKKRVLPSQERGATHTFQQVVSTETLSVLHIFNHEVSKFVYMARGPKSISKNRIIS